MGAAMGGAARDGCGLGQAMPDLDEPLVALDLSAQTQVCALLQSHLASGGMALVTSHQPLQLGSAQYASYRLQA